MANDMTAATAHMPTDMSISRGACRSRRSVLVSFVAPLPEPGLQSIGWAGTDPARRELVMRSIVTPFRNVVVECRQLARSRQTRTKRAPKQLQRCARLPRGSNHGAPRRASLPAGRPVPTGRLPEAYDEVVLRRSPGATAAALVTLVTLGLIAVDLTDAAARRWWADRAFATDVVAGILVLLITVLVVDQVVRVRQLQDRAHATAAQAAILMVQAARAKQTVSAAINGPRDRDAALDEVRTYMTILSISAPVLIDARVSRTFLEQAQRLGAELARGLAAGVKASGETSTASDSRLEGSYQRLRAVSAPLLEVLTAEQRSAAGGGESQSSGE